ncbi:MAG: hypothetical protein ACP5NE_02505 [Candidatus Micrarchaeia archaeon]
MNGDTKARIMYIAIYSLGFFTGLSAYVLSEEIKVDNPERVRFHSLQASALGAIAFALLLLPYISVFGVVIWVYGMYIGYSAGYDRDIEVPIISMIAKIYK